MRMMRTINQAEKYLFTMLTASGNANLALMSTECQSVEAACICYVQPKGEEFEMIPLAGLVNDGLFAMLMAP